jgi:hypothetical protein
VVSVGLANGVDYVIKMDSFEIEFEIKNLIGVQRQNQLNFKNNASCQNALVDSGILKVFHILDSQIEPNLNVLTKRNQLYNSEKNKTFDYEEQFNISKNFLFLFEKLSHKKSQQNIFSRLKMFSMDLNTGQPELLQTIQGNKFDSRIKFLYSTYPENINSIDLENKVNIMPSFVSVHEEYSKVWECVEDKNKKKWKWKDVYTHWRGNVISQTMERSQNGFTFYMICSNKNNPKITQIEKYLSRGDCSIMKNVTDSEKDIKQIIVSKEFIYLFSDDQVFIRNKKTLELISNKKFEKIIFARALTTENISLMAIVNKKLTILNLNTETNNFEINQLLQNSLQKDFSTLKSNEWMHVLFDDLSE